jgi:hypothetical protein
LDGQPLISGSIDFVPEKGTPGSSTGSVIERGKYSITKGLREGKYRVAIQSTRRRPDKKVPDPLGGDMIADEEAIVFEEFDRICHIGPGHNTYNFDLKEDVKKKRKRP